MEVDLENTERIMKQIQYSEMMRLPDPAERMCRLMVARNQNQYLRNKYPDIEEMLLAAEMFPKEQGRASSHSNDPEKDEYKFLKQDCYGIIWHVLKKESLRGLRSI